METKRGRRRSIRSAAPLAASYSSSTVSRPMPLPLVLLFTVDFEPRICLSLSLSPPFALSLHLCVRPYVGTPRICLFFAISHIFVVLNVIARLLCCKLVFDQGLELHSVFLLVRLLLFPTCFPLPRMPRKTSCRALKKSVNNSNLIVPSPEKDCYEGERLANLLQSIHREIKSARTIDGNSLPEKIWLKQQFSVGVNDVTRVLERMAPCTELQSSSQLSPLLSCNNRTSSVKLQVVLVASDCNPRWLIKHLPNLASSRKVPLIFVRDNKKGSLRLGELVNMKTAIAVGVKARENTINKLLEKILQQDGVEPDCPISAETSDA